MIVYKVVRTETKVEKEEDFSSGVSCFAHGRWECVYRLYRRMRPRVAGSRLFAFDTQEHARKFIDDFFFAFAFRRHVAPTTSSYAPATSATSSSSFTLNCQKGYACILECTTSQADTIDVAGTFPHWDTFWQGVWDRERNPDYKALPASKYFVAAAQRTLALQREKPYYPTYIEFSYGGAPTGTVICQSLTPVRAIPVPVPVAGVDDTVDLTDDDDDNDDDAE